jgi:hypothetical protein
MNMGFELNANDQCVENCTVNGSPCNIAWYVDDLKISHKDPKVVSDVIEKFEEPVGKMTMTWGREHKFLGMKIRYNENRTATATMRGYLQEAIDKSGIEIKQTVITPGTRQLFEIDESSRESWSM